MSQTQQANDPLHDEQTRIRLKALQQIDAPLPTQYDMKRYTQIDPTMKGRMRFSSHRFAQTLALGPGVIDWLEESYPDLVKPFPRVQPFTSIQVGIGHAWFGGA